MVWMAGICNKTWCKCECWTPMETSIGGICCLEISEICKPRFSATRIWTFVDQIHILCYNILSEKTSLGIWFPPNVDLWQIRIKVFYTSNFVVIVFRKTFYFINQIFFFIRDLFFCERIFSKEHPTGFRGSVIIEKQYLIVRIARSSHSQVLKNLLNHGEL